MNESETATKSVEQKERQKYMTVKGFVVHLEATASSLVYLKNQIDKYSDKVEYLDLITAGA